MKATPRGWAGVSGAASAAGFTLTELLVSIAIVVVLAAMALALVPRMRERSTRTVCISNLRQIGTMMNGYATEHSGLYPSGGPPEGYIRRLCRESFPDTYPDTGGKKDGVFFDGGPGGFFICPHNKQGLRELTKSYLANGRIVGITDEEEEGGWKSMGSNSSYRPRPLSGIGDPARAFLVIEHWVPATKLWRGNDIKASPEWKGENFPAHGDGRHYLYVDGHVEYHVEDPGLGEQSNREIHYHGK